jgi:hypothetical protein
MNKTLAEDFTAAEARTAESVWIVDAESDRMYKVELVVANDRLITIIHNDNKIAFTYAYGEWRARGYILNIEV